LSRQDRQGGRAGEGQVGRSAWSGWLPVSILVAAATVAYHNSFRGAFVFDDLGRIVNRESPLQLWPPWELWGGYRPMSRLTLALNQQIGGEDVFSYHVLNFAVHVAGGLTLFGLVRRSLALPKFGGRFDASGEWIAAAVALLWLVHPLQTQAVTYVIQRVEALMALFFVLLLYCLVRGARASRAWRWYGGAVASLYLGLCSKEPMAMAPLVAVMYDRVLLASSWRELVRRRGWVYLTFVGLLIWFVFLIAPEVTSSQSVGLGQEHVTAIEYARTQPGVILHYLRLAFWPDHLCLDYDWPVANEPSEYVVPGIVVAALVTGSTAALVTRPAVGLLGLSFFLILAPTSSIMPIRDLAVEHRMYLPLACLITLVVAAAWELGERLVRRGRLTQTQRNGGLVAVLVVVSVALIARTVARNHDYRSQVAIWATVVDLRPQNARANHNLANKLVELNRPDQAVAVVQDSIARCEAAGHPTHEHHLLLGEILTRQKRWEPAIEHLQIGIRRSELPEQMSTPERNQLAAAYASLASSLDLQGNPSRALTHYRKAIELRPDYAPPYAMLGEAQMKLGAVDAAIEAWQQAATLQPDWFEVRRDLARALMRAGRHGEALSQLRAAHDLRPEAFDVTVQLAHLLATHPEATRRDPPQAVRLAESACRAQPGNPAGWEVLAAALAARGQYHQAVLAIDRAIRLMQSIDRQQAAVLQQRRKGYQSQVQQRRSEP